MCLAVPGQDREHERRRPARRAWPRSSFGGIIKEVSLAYVPEARVGDYVIVHVGFALSKLDEAEALETLAILDQLETRGTAVMKFLDEYRDPEARDEADARRSRS